MKIEIELVKEEQPLVWTGWKVTLGDKYADGLGYDEMIGLVSVLTMPEKRPMLNWLKTEESHKAQKDPNRFNDPNGVEDKSVANEV